MFSCSSIISEESRRKILREIERGYNNNYNVNINQGIMSNDLKNLKCGISNEIHYG